MLRRPWTWGRAPGPGPRGPGPSPPPPRTLSARCWTRFAPFGVKPFFKVTKRADQVLSKLPNRADQVLQSNNMTHVLSTSISRRFSVLVYTATSQSRRHRHQLMYVHAMLHLNRAGSIPTTIYPPYPLTLLLPITTYPTYPTSQSHHRHCIHSPTQPSPT